MPHKETNFELQPGRKIGPRYVVESFLGRGTEGEVYKIRELKTDICRAAKLYFSHHDPKHRLPITHAQKLDILRRCPIVLQYHHSEIITIRRQKVVAMISELCEGQPLDLWLAKHRGKRLSPYKALHVLYNLALGLETIHDLKQYHADVHSQNILIKPVGVTFELKLIDFYDWGKPTSYKLKQDLADTIHVFYECLGSKRHYPNLPRDIKYICAGMRRQLILERFPTMTALRRHLETFEWSSMT